MKIRLNTKIYPLEAIYGACYVFIDRAYVLLDSPDPGMIEVSFKLKNEMPDGQREKLAGEFHNELLSYVQRINIAKTNKKIREYIVERALYAAVDSGNQLTDTDELDDPLGIAVPWEEKYGKKS